jgi:ATP-dependent RNA helicase SUPV3L1/SUV3
MRRLKQRESLVAQVTENGEVRIDDQFVGHLEGFRFRLDPAAAGQEAQTLRAAAFAALAPAFSLRADKFYNAPDPEIDVTEQGGLMWGELAVGRLVAGPDPLSPQVLPFVDEEAGPEVAEKVRRRLGHWIDRRITALFEPLNALKGDEALTGMARGIAFRLVEAMGILPRSEIADDVKALDQEQRAGLRRHGVRFGQYTVFLPTMLKPAPTRLRLVLWSLAEGFDEFPEAPPPGLVTIAARQGVPQGYYARAGYRLAGERAIRIDMLERLADLVRGLDARAGFEATADMLSITGLTLEQFARLMEGMGYRAEQGTRPKARPAPVAGAPNAEGAALPEPAAAEVADGAGEVSTESSSEDSDREAGSESVAAAEVVADAVSDAPEAAAETLAAEAAEGDAGGAEAPVAAPAEDAAAGQAAATAPMAEAEMEVFYTFVRAPRQRPRHGGGQPQHGAEPRGEGQERGAFRGRRGRDGKPAERSEGKPQQKPGGGKGKPQGKPAASARPPRPEKPIDPDNPFAALLVLKQRG